MEEPAVVTRLEDVLAAATTVPLGTRIPIVATIEVDDPFAAYCRARQGDSKGECYLETTGGQSGWGYFGIDPIDLIEVETTATDVGPRSPTLNRLADRLGQERLLHTTDCPVPYPCGAIGWLAYDVVRELEQLPNHAIDDRELPAMQLAVFDRLAAWQEPREPDRPTTLFITACPPITDDGQLAFENGCERIFDLVERILAGDPLVGPPPVETNRIQFRSTVSKDVFEQKVRQVKDYIRDGDTFQVNLSQRLEAPAAVHPVDTFAALRRVNPAPYSALLEFPGVDLISASPELLLRIDGDQLITEPIAGTRPRGQKRDEDQELERDLLEDEKERAEHAMLVDLERNDLGKVSEYGTVEVAEYRRVDRYSAVMHLVSVVTGQRRSTANLAEVIGAVFPGGTITGAPKPRTMEIIEKLEDRRRGPYTGSIGLFGFDERATMNIVIRTLVRYDEEYHLRVGAGIVHDSVPAREYDETIDKARALIMAVDEALGDQTSMEIHVGETP